MPPHQVPYTVKLKTCLKMCIHRLRYAQEKQISVAKQNRRQVAQLLSEGQEQRARYRAETLILADIHAELFEILLVYCELLTARVHILATLAAENEPAHLPLGSNTPPATPSPNPESNFGMESSNDKPSSERDAVRSMVYAAPYIPEVRELNQLSDLLSHSCKGFLNSPLTAPEKITKKCNPPLPSEELVNLYLTEIAKTYDVTCSLYDASSTSNYDEGDEIDQDDTDSGDETSGCQDEKDDEKKNSNASKSKNNKNNTPSNDEALNKKKKKDESSSKKKKEDNSTKIDAKAKKNFKNTETDLDALRKRFEALRR